MPVAQIPYSPSLVRAASLRLRNMPRAFSLGKPNWNCAPATVVSQGDRKSTRLNSSHGYISYAVFCLKTTAGTGRRADLYRSGPLDVPAGAGVLLERLVGGCPGACLTGAYHARLPDPPHAGMALLSAR